MSMDPNRWVNTIPFIGTKSNQEKYKLDSNRWVKTLPKKDENILILSNAINSNSNSNSNSRSGKKYSLTMIGFVIGLILVSVIKNETRNLQKAISNLQTSINTLKLDLHKTILEHEVITSPENISRLANKYLELHLISYKKSQIKQLSKKRKILVKQEKAEFKKGLKKTIKGKQSEVKLILTKKIEAKRTELAKLKELYSRPEKIPKELKQRVAKKIKAKRNELSQLKKLFSEPENIMTSKKVQQWAGLQIVKIFLGIPIVPGR